MISAKAKVVLDEVLNATNVTMADVRRAVYRRFEQQHRELQRMPDEPKEDEPVTEPEQPPADEPVHISAADCWCGPVEDEPGVWVHRPARSAHVQRILPHAR